MQRGSLLSHSAIVAREIGLPCVVAIPDLMQRLTDGEWVADPNGGVYRHVQKWIEKLLLPAEVQAQDPPARHGSQARAKSGPGD